MRKTFTRFTGMALAALMVCSLAACGSSTTVGPDLSPSEGQNTSQTSTEKTGITGLKLSKSSVTLKVGGTEELSVMTTPADADQSTLVWTVTDPTIAQVENGKITALKNGTTVVTVKTADGAVYQTCTVVVSGEDDPGKVLKARLTAAGADMSRVMVVTSDAYFARTGSPLCIPDTSFAKYVGKAAPALVIIDPLQSFLPAGVEMASRNQMRSALLPLKALCAKHGCAALISMHTNKRANVSGRARLADSSDIWDIARSVLMMGRDKNSEKLYLSHEKSSYSAPARTALLHIEQAQVEGVTTAVAVFDSRTDKKDADFVEERRVRTAQTKEDTAQAILNVLAESKLGSMPSTQLRAEVMKEMGCSDRTYERAYADMIRKGELHKRQIMQKNGERGWFTFLAYGGKTNGEVTI